MPGSSNNKEHTKSDRACEDLFEESDGDRVRKQKNLDNDTIAQSKGQKSQLGNTSLAETDRDPGLRMKQHNASGT